MCCCEYSRVVLVGFAAATRGEWLGGELYRRWSKTVSPTPFILLLPLLAAAAADGGGGGDDDDGYDAAADDNHMMMMMMMMHR